mmetsp:Transcript_44562/g.95745  ORF Transcript_44562/g.95745 Transcript_44562/m.95745 type:complete len:80 (-) Transcript_44562:391-630(-)
MERESVTNLGESVAVVVMAESDSDFHNDFGIGRSFWEAVEVTSAGKNGEEEDCFEACTGMPSLVSSTSGEELSNEGVGA